MFDKLVAELSSEERRELLSKLRGEIYIPEAISTADDVPEGSVEEEYGNPGFLERIIIFFIALFSGRPMHEVRESLMYKRAARDLERDFPGIVDFKKGVLLGGFKQALAGLSSSFSVFIDPLQHITGGTKEEFYTFLGGLEMPELQAELQAAFEPLYDDYAAGSEEPAAIKREIEFKLEDLLNTIDRTEHDKMYTNARQIAWLRAMAFFPYNKILHEYESEGEVGEYCYINKVIKTLGELADILAGYPAAPTETLYEALITYRYRDEIDKADFEYEQRLKEFIAASGKALEQFAGFVQRIPFIRIIRVYRWDFSYFPRRATGGEDWLLLFRQFWFDRLNDRYASFLVKRELNEMIEKAAVFLKQKGLPPRGRYRTDAWGYGTRPKYETSFAFLDGFYRNVFLPEINPTLKIVLIDGEFYKEQNRQEFTDAYNEIVKIGDLIKAVETDLTDEGEKGKQFQSASNELISEAHRAKKIASLVQIVDKDVGALIESTLQYLSLLEKVLRGIVYGEKGGRYDTLSNIGYLGKHGNVSFIVRLSTVHKKTETAISILQSLYTIERAET